MAGRTDSDISPSDENSTKLKRMRYQSDELFF
jgi:hypothetical protein